MRITSKDLLVALHVSKDVQINQISSAEDYSFYNFFLSMLNFT